MKLPNGLYEPLMVHFPTRFIDVLTLACAIIINNESIAYKVTNFIFDHYTELTHQLSSFLSKLYSELGEDLTEIEAFFDDFLKSHTEIFETNSQVVIDLDSTNFTTHSILAIAAKGFNKDHLNLPCVGKMTLTLRETGIPIWSNLFNGSILDKSQGLLCIESLREKGIENGLICMDAGEYRYF
ncbi:MAG: hypothetical protein K2H85_11435 [Allobaculum sp.]|nr:hypothetical protein [Allobaculum sp.]